MPILAAGPGLKFASSGDVRTVAALASLGDVPIADIIHPFSVGI